jgi:hypothetical protein
MTTPNDAAKTAEPVTKRTRAVDRSIAFHEAGHAAIALALGATPTHATIDPTETLEIDPSTRGAIDRSIVTFQLPCIAEHMRRVEEEDWECRPNPVERHSMECAIVITMAGRMAEKRARAIEICPTAHWKDIMQVERLARAMGHGGECDPVYEAHLRFLRIWARELVIEHWTLIEDIANALLRKRSQNYAELRAIYVRWVKRRWGTRGAARVSASR